MRYTVNLFLFGCIFNYLCQTNARPQESDSSKRTDLPKCGRHNSCGLINPSQNCSGSSNPFETQFGEWPHMCAIMKSREIEDKTTQEFFAGASLIAPGVLLTAAHWVK